MTAMDEIQAKINEEMRDRKSRYVVVPRSISAHCCFVATVIDTLKDDDWICECFEIEHANKIAAAMNQIEDWRLS